MPRIHVEEMVKASRIAVKTLTINKSRDIIVDKLLKQCEEGAHSRCTGWAVLKKEISPIDANYFLKCACTCHHNKRHQTRKQNVRKNRKMKKKPEKRKKSKKGNKRSKKR